MLDPSPTDTPDATTAPDAGALSDLLGSRICHDLISPLGAIANGVELLTLSGQGDIPEIALIAESVEVANAKIRFYRVAFGHADRYSTIGSGEIREILAALGKSGRTRTLWEPDGPVVRPDAKLAFLMILCAEAAMPRGGEIRVTKEDGAWRITAHTPSPRIETALWDALVGNADLPAPAPGTAQFPLAARYSASLGREVSVATRPDGLTISF